MIQCVWCKTEIDTSAKPGWYNCECKAISVDVGIGYYRFIGNFEDMIFSGDQE
jgi:hypothetical protein